MNTLEEQYNMLNEEMIVESIEKSKDAAWWAAFASIIGNMIFPNASKIFVPILATSAFVGTILDIIIAYRYYRGAKQKKILQDKEYEKIEAVRKIANKKFNNKIEDAIAKRKLQLDKELINV